MKGKLFLAAIVFTLSALLLAGCNGGLGTSDVRSPEEVSPNEFTPNEGEGLPPEDEPAFDPCDAPEAPTLRVPSEVESIEAAVAELEDHGRVLVAPGEYLENIAIRPGTHILIQAEAEERPALFPAEHERPVIQVASGASLCLTGMEVHGARAGLVLGSEESGGAAHAVALREALVTNAEYGVYGLAEGLHFEGVSIEGNHYGVVIAGSVWLVDAMITGNVLGVLISGESKPTCADAAYVDNQKIVKIQKVNVSNNKDGGIAICNVSSAVVQDAYVHKNGYVGVQIHNTPQFLLDDLRVGETQLWNGGYGDGLVVVHSSGIVQNGQFSANKRANIIYYGNSAGLIQNNKILYAIIAIYLDGKDGSFPYPTVQNNYMYGNTQNGVTTGLNIPPSKPPKLPPPGVPSP